jgi:PAS domain S-box-containing protein
MTDSNRDLNVRMQMRLEAEGRLRDGTAPFNSGWTLGPDALALLYRLASDPDSAADALKLLNELQAYQVELDMQRAQIEADERELAEDLARYKGLFDYAPVGYLVADPEGHIIESNPAGVRLFGVEPEEIPGNTVASFLAPESRPLLAGALQELHEGAREATCELLTGDRGKGSRRLRMSAGLAPGGDVVLMVVSRAD